MEDGGAFFIVIFHHLFNEMTFVMINQLLKYIYNKL